MKRKITKLAVIGFIAGMIIGNLISFLICDKNVRPLVTVSDILINRTGSVTAATIVNTLLSGLFGAVSFAGVIFHDPNEFDWGLTKAAILHFLLIMAVNIPIAIYCGWLRPGFPDLLIWTSIMAMAYFIIWMIMYTRYKHKTAELNELIRKDRKL